MMEGTTATAIPLLEMRGIEKSFPSVRALKGVDLDLRAGEVLALLGENGAGKSTLIKILGGAHGADVGTVRIDGREVDISSPPVAQAAGVAVIYQEFNLVPDLSVRENIFLGRERTIGWVNAREESRGAKELLARLGMQIDPEARCASLSVAEQQTVEIARALSRNARILVMDEPSATLTPQEVASLFRVIRELKGQGIGVIYISHRLEEIDEIADRVLVLRDGEQVGSHRTGEVGRERLIEMMVGRKLDQEFPRREASVGEPRLVVRNLSRGTKVRDVSFEVRRGEIVVLTGLVGAGRTETARLVFGADRPDRGTVELDGRVLRIRGPRDAIREGICLLTEDRKGEGLILGLSALENFGLPNMKRWTTAGFIRPRTERAGFASYAEQLRLKAASPDQRVRTLSGGNQQKVVLAKWLQAHGEVLLFDEPTRGIDVGAKYEIYLLMNELAAAGKAILMITSELPEALGMADRILVMHEGRITGEIADVARSNQEAIMELAVR